MKLRVIAVIDDERKVTFLLNAQHYRFTCIAQSHY
tara:strand:- start:293 stop:397 length:105 start_codon:yes stop_codon:yes gene_type:complete